MDIENTLVEPKNKIKFDGLGNDLFSIIPGIEIADEAPSVLANELNEKDFNKNWVIPNKPCLIKGAVKKWPAVQKFKSKDYWLSVCDNFEIKVYPHMNHNVWDVQKVDSEDISFHEAIERLFNNEDYILSIPSERITSDNHFSELLKETLDFSFLSGSIKPRMYDQRRFFMYRRASTAWHYHNIDETLMCQISGAKKVALLSPSIPNPKEVMKFLNNERYLNGESLKNFMDLKPMVVNVQEGDALYIPPYWFHTVVPDDGEVGFTYAYCWKSPLHKFGDFSNFFVRQLYRDGLWPFKTVSLIMPFLGIYSGLLNVFRIIQKAFR